MDEPQVLEMDRGGKTITVTLISANHCPGAVMFLFEGQFGRILYTGDFRYCGPMLNDYAFLTHCTSNIDVLYIDNTFLDPKCSFPSRQDAIIEILGIIRSHNDANVVIGMRQLGKEELLVELARSLKENIGVDESRYKVLEIINTTDVFEVSTSCRIRAVDWSTITPTSMESWNRESKTIAILPSALEVALGPKALCRHEAVHVVPYSDHCSYEELMEFVKMVEPVKVCPILQHNPKDRLSVALPRRSDMSHFADLTNKSTEPVSGRHCSPADGADSDNGDDNSSDSNRKPCASGTVLRPKRSAVCKLFKFRTKTSRRGVVYDSAHSDQQVGNGETNSGSVDEHDGGLERRDEYNATHRRNFHLQSNWDLWNQFPLSDWRKRSEIENKRASILKALQPVIRQEAARLAAEKYSITAGARTKSHSKH